MTATPAVSASLAALLHHVRTGRARSRAELVALTGASRNTISGRVDRLIGANLLAEGGRGWSTGGRPPTLLQFNSEAGCVLAVDLGVTSVDVAVTDLSARLLATAGHPIDIAEGPGAVLAEATRLGRQVLAAAGLVDADVRAVGVGVPGPVAYDYWTTVATMEAIGHRDAFGLNWDPSHFVWQDLDPVGFLWDFRDRIHHVDCKDAKKQVGNGRNGWMGSHLP